MPEKLRYAIRGVPREVARVLRKKVAQFGRNQRADWPDLVGQWIADPAFDEVLASQRQIDWDKWK